MLRVAFSPKTIVSLEARAFTPANEKAPFIIRVVNDTDTGAAAYAQVDIAP